MQGVATLAYTAPEAVDGPRTPATDIWSFGVVLYEMLTGQQPLLQMHWAQVRTARMGFTGFTSTRPEDPGA
jgi:serine/threonine protein kinase